MKSWTCRLACPGDARALEPMQEQSFRQLGSGHYSSRQINAFIREIGTLDMNLIERGTYYVVEDRGVPVGCGGWGTVTPHYQPHQSDGANTATEPRLRAFYVDPGYARRGIGRAIVDQVECDIDAAGYTSVHLAGTLSGEQFYSSLGYRKTADVSVETPSGVVLPGVEMVKPLD